MSEEEKETFTNFQETYAGFLTHTDEQIGRFVESLKAVGEFEDTMIVFEPIMERARWEKELVPLIIH